MVSRIEQIEAASHEWLARGQDGGGQPATVVLMLFHTPLDVPPTRKPAKARRRRAAV